MESIVKVGARAKKGIYTNNYMKIPSLRIITEAKINFLSPNSSSWPWRL